VETNTRLRPFLYALTAVSGIVDAVSYLGLGRVFTANMTGNVVLLGFAIAGAPGGVVLMRHSLALPLVVSAVIAGVCALAAVFGSRSVTVNRPVGGQGT